MKKAICAVLLGAGLALAMPAAGYFETGNSLLSKVEDDESVFHRGVSMGFALGVHDMYVMHTVKDGLVLNYCAPEGLTAGQLRRVAEKALKANPEELHMPAAWTLLKAFQEAWPCE